jgi:subtilase family serine protease
VFTSVVSHLRFNAMLALTVLIASLASGQSSHIIAGNTPRLPSSAENLGPENPTKVISITLWLRQHNKADLDKRVREMYQRQSPTFHKWLTKEEYNSRFAPTAREAQVVRNFLASRGLKILAVDKNNHFVTAQGRVGDVQNALHVQIGRVRINGETLRVNLSDPLIEGNAGELVAAVQGLSDAVFRPHARRPIDPDTGKPFPAVPLANAGPDGKFFAANCLRPPEIQAFTTNGGFPRALYRGNRYGSNITAGPPNLPPCGYDSAELQKAYGLKSMFKAGFDGRGQTIVIVDAFGSKTIHKDANTFSELNGLPKLNSSNFQIFHVGVHTGCTPADGCDPSGWIVETTLDVEWAHTVAPKANIILIETKDNTFTNLDLGVFFAAANQLGSVISNSYGAPEILVSPTELTVQDSNNQLAASLGESANYSTGDSGDFFAASGGAFITVSAPASSPFATGVGGTSVFLNFDKSIKLQTGWGNNLTRIANTIAEGSTPVVPPLSLGFNGGAGGGASGFFAKPSYQASLPGDFRLLPDIAFTADPFTGVEIVIFDPSIGGQVVEVIGGTSLACPMFSALWAIANQAVGQPLGQAAPLLYGLPSGAITDVIDETSANNATGTIRNPPNPKLIETADDLAAPLENTVNFVSALYNSPFSTRWFVITFGTDSSLTTGVGWDNVTGLGTPNGLTFVQDVMAAAPSK